MKNSACEHAAKETSLAKGKEEKIVINFLR